MRIKWFFIKTYILSGLNVQKRANREHCNTRAVKFSTFSAEEIWIDHFVLLIGSQVCPSGFCLNFLRAIKIRYSLNNHRRMPRATVKG